MKNQRKSELVFATGIYLLFSSVLDNITELSEIKLCSNIIYPVFRISQKKKWLLIPKHVSNLYVFSLRFVWESISHKDFTSIVSTYLFLYELKFRTKCKAISKRKSGKGRKIFV